MDMLLELLGANVELVVAFFMSAIVILLGMLAGKTDNKLDDKVLELLKKNQEVIEAKAAELAKKKIKAAVAKRKARKAKK